MKLPQSISSQKKPSESFYSASWRPQMKIGNSKDLYDITPRASQFASQRHIDVQNNPSLNDLTSDNNDLSHNTNALVILDNHSKLDEPVDSPKTVMIKKKTSSSLKLERTLFVQKSVHDGGFKQIEKKRRNPLYYDQIIEELDSIQKLDKDLKKVSSRSHSLSSSEPKNASMIDSSS